MNLSKVQLSQSQNQTSDADCPVSRNDEEEEKEKEAYPPPAPPGTLREYVTLERLDDAPLRVNVYAVIYRCDSVREVKSTGDYEFSLTLIDPKIGNDRMPIRFSYFSDDKTMIQNCQETLNHGDVIRIHRGRVSMSQKNQYSSGRPYLKGNKASGCAFVVWSGESEDMKHSLISSNLFTAEEYDKIMVPYLRNWWKGYSARHARLQRAARRNLTAARHRQGLSDVSDDVTLGDNSLLDQSQLSTSGLLIKPFAVFRLKDYQNVIVEVIGKIKTNNHRVFIRCWDGTKPFCKTGKLCVERETGETEESWRDTKMDTAMDKLLRDCSVDIAVYGEHKIIANELEPGDVIEIVNLHYFFGQTALEPWATLHEGTNYGRTIRRVSQEERVYQILKERVERVKNELASKTAELEKENEDSTGSQEKIIEQSSSKDLSEEQLSDQMDVEYSQDPILPDVLEGGSPNP